MHIEPGLVDGSKIWLSYITAAGVGGYALREAVHSVQSRGLASVALRSVIASGLALSFFEVLPHYPVGVSEVHLILGSTLFLLLGSAPAAIGLTTALLVQGLLFAPFDLPQYGMNVTTLLAPLFALKFVADRVIPRDTAFVNLSYRQALALSTAYQAGIVSWVAFWALYGHGFTAENLSQITMFGGAYLLVILAEPLVDLAVLAAAKTMRSLRDTPFVTRRLFTAS